METEVPDRIKCPKCRAVSLLGTKFCPDCGTDLRGERPIVCGNCGTENKAKSKYCSNCGKDIQNPLENDPDILHLNNILRGKYVVQKPLGEGGFGRVFLVEHVGLGKRDVVKLLGASVSQVPHVRDRFFQEAKIIARLNHPHIVPIIDVSDTGGRPYYIMNYIDGGSLEDLLLKEKNISVERSLSITEKILSALSEVHEKGIVHRDLKPANILLNKKGEPVLIDFGIAKVESVKMGTTFIGTRAYSSPEQIQEKEVKGTSDLYSLGIILFELLTGKLPFEGSDHTIAEQHISKKLPPITNLIENSALTDSLQAILQKACAKEPSARYSSAKEMREAIEAVVRKPKIDPQKEEWEREYKKKMEELQKKEEELKNREKIVVQDKKAEPQIQETPKTFTNSLGMEFILIPAGEFMMGAVPQDKEASDNEKPQHKVRITKPFYLGKYPVTQGDWEKLMGNNPSEFKLMSEKGLIFKKIIFKSQQRNPVERVMWNDCQEFIKKLNQKEGKTYRLPREAEWEYAARAGGSVIYTFGDDASKLGEYAWYYENSNETTHPVGEKKPNNWGLHDMMGNVWEWCEDWYNEKYYVELEIIDPIGYTEGKYKIVRGGSWHINARYCRVSHRGGYTPGSWELDVGFRLLLPLA